MDWTVWFSITLRDKRFFETYRPAVPPQFPVPWVLVLKWPGVIPRLKVHGAVLLLLPYDFIACTEIILYFIPFILHQGILQKMLFTSMKLCSIEIVYSFGNSKNHSSVFLFPKINVSVRYMERLLVTSHSGY
jgi:hypothetical protein